MASSVASNVALACCFSGFICLAARSKRALTFGGAIAAFPVGVICVLAGLRHTAVLLAFFISSSVATHIGRRRKMDAAASDAKKGRSWHQVLGSGAVATALAALHIATVGVGNDRTPASPVLASFVASFAFGAADTWASELGVLSSARPRMITHWRVVPRGTNGGVTLLGTVSSCLGGLLIGLAAFALGSPTQPSLVMLGLLCGFFGSAFDSLLGATLQYTGVTHSGIVSSESQPRPGLTSVGGIPLLSNTQVNFVSSLAVAIAVGLTWDLL